MAEEPREVGDRPVPPPFMWGCPECARWLLRLGRQWDAPEGCFWEQLHVARHITAAHPDDVPPQHLDGCDLCPYYARRKDDAAALMWAQHRARDLFMPPSIARLI
ncbi:hypothetical protein EYS09_13265 [Streptomyces kasugaensis]|uniref:Uncharacterized protein n=1 Tax=Streptomyces kasugaensis TaxID=1946 RepID=A0A4V2JIM6_STRKA|nr:hypothetical protein [Streptomyces kasugaensis]TBO59211.1 hypothetical protein EYS09_13265 [Streptomyces kasugaensis]